jgi:hypothetical protein
MFDKAYDFNKSLNVTSAAEMARLVQQEVSLLPFFIVATALSARSVSELVSRFRCGVLLNSAAERSNPPTDLNAVRNMRNVVP